MMFKFVYKLIKFIYKTKLLSLYLHLAKLLYFCHVGDDMKLIMEMKMLSPVLFSFKGFFPEGKQQCSRCTLSIASAVISLTTIKTYQD